LGEESQIHVPTSATSLAPLRRWLNERLDGLDELLRNDVLLAADEIVSNVIKHGAVDGEPLTVSIALPGKCVRLDVCSQDAGFDPNESPPGWGLYLVSRIASRWGAERRGPAWCVWFERDFDPATG
jgi:anti-sigma regulatory factor (Ser/Thr protein kinase)